MSNTKLCCRVRGHDWKETDELIGHFITKDDIEREDDNGLIWLKTSWAPFYFARTIFHPCSRCGEENPKRGCAMLSGQEDEERLTEMDFEERRMSVKRAADGYGYVLNMRFDATKRGALLVEGRFHDGVLIELCEFIFGENPSLTIMDRPSWEAYNPDEIPTKNKCCFDIFGGVSDGRT